MIRSLLMGLVAGQRSMVPLLAITAAARRGSLPAGAPLQHVTAHPVIAGGTAVLAAAEMAGDKMKSAPDRIVPIGLIVRAMTAGYAGAALVPRGQRLAGGAVAVLAALCASYVGWRIRCKAMERRSQTETGVIEDVVVLASGLAIALSPPP